MVDSEPEDATELGALSLDAQPVAEASEEMAAAYSDYVSNDMELDDAAVMAGESARMIAPGGQKDTGDLYGVHTPHAGDTALGAPEYMDSFEGADRGENWLEALSEHATESGPAPEEEIVIIDDSDPDAPPHPTESGDRPVADKGSGGPGGL